MSLEARLIAFAQAVGADIRTLLSTRGNLAALTTTDRTSIVNALNEVRAQIGGGGGGGATVNDAVQNSINVWSSNRTATAISDAITALVNGAPAAFDTLLELSNALATQDSSVTNLLTAVGNRVRFDAVQTLTVAQQLQASQNIGLGNPQNDLAAVYEAAKL